MNFNLASPLFEYSRGRGSGLALSVGPVDLCYLELGALAQRVGAWLTAGTSRAPGYVVILASRSLEAYAGILGTCWAGDAYVPLDPQLPGERIARLLEMIRPIAVVADDAGMSALASVRQASQLRVLSSLNGLPAHDPLDRPRPVQADQVVYMIFTSGSTGVPKGVMVPAQAVHHLVTVMQQLYKFRPEDRFSNAYNLSFDGSVHDLFTAWNAGASVNVVPDTQLMAPLRFIREKQLTVWASVPSTAVFLERMHMLRPGTFSTLRYSILAGEPLPVRSAQAWQRAAPHSTVDNLYGPTECCVFSTMERISEPANVTPNRGIVAIGKPLPGFETLVLDENDSPVPSGKSGELLLSGPQLAQGYFQDPERTAARFLLRQGKIWYRTGDLVYQDTSGSYHHQGRIDSQVKILGHRVELGEVEAQLSEVCGSDSVAAVAWPMEHGSARGIVVFHCSDRSSDEIRIALMGRLPRYMVPHQVCHLENIPLTSNGKIDRKLLVETLEQRPRDTS
ncbi:MAG TPA: amino acid adenylation domain-containing protein [Candidatus Angelobacter sp.]|nr:amino acid adenylation domain-containing protein [Candidatus Angelobacter sp.]